ncbi:MAG: hypothetical protein HY043_22540 [Verrucomicrobia bacterium]|nr:hypothetical protein [Verrucomicrobiota bacterium]
MRSLREKFYKPLLVTLALVLLVSVSFTQRALNRDRSSLGLTRVTPLENAPPVLAFTTVALGGFRGLIANMLWIRATELQDEDKFFELIQLADWITKLQPHFVTVWTHQSWNMAYNISVKFSDLNARWPWVLRAIELLRDEGLRYNPQEPDIYRELAWYFQHKMGADLDDAHWVYKEAWAKLMKPLFPNGRANYDELLNPQTDEVNARVQTMRDKYKLEPARMKRVDERFGPFDWRMPEAHAIYWAMLCKERLAELGQEKAKKDDLIKLRRVIYQSMQLAFQRGRFIENKVTGKLEVSANLDIVANANAAYEQMMDEDEPNRDHIQTGHKNFLKSAVYFLYAQNRITESKKWFAYLKEKYPQAVPPGATVEDFALDMIQTDVSETSHMRVRNAIEGLLTGSFYNLAIGQQDDSVGRYSLALKAWQRFQSEVSRSEKRVGLPPFEEIRQEVLDRVINPTNEIFSPPVINQLITALGLPPPTNAPPPAASAPPAPAGAPEKK